jgi:arabinofuranosyltransferase
MTLLAWVISSLTEQRSLRLGLYAGVLAGSLYHQVAFGHFGSLERVDQLDEHITSAQWNWGDIGRTLGSLFPRTGGEVVIATTAAGAIPYYSNLTSVDMLGLNDRWIAREGRIVGFKPGHQKLATFDYLLSRKVNLVLGHPQVIPADFADRLRYRVEDLKDFHVLDADPARLPVGACVVEIPLNPKFSLLALYLTPNPAVDLAIRSRNLRTFPVRR